jgi:hypothetical protein
MDSKPAFIAATKETEHEAPANARVNQTLVISCQRSSGISVKVGVALRATIHVWQNDPCLVKQRVERDSLCKVR